ncbi:MAG: glutamate ABC transporter substrate-binding protein [Acidimicrobiales bacterium]
MRSKMLALGALLVLTAAACGGDDGGSAASPETAAAGSATTAAGSETTEAGGATEIEIPAGSSVEAIKNEGKLVIGVKYDVPLFGLKNPTTNEIEGFDVEIGKLIGEHIFGEGAEDRIEFVEAVSKNREPFIQDGTVDLVISTYTINDTRKEVVDFAGPYYIAGQDILVKSDNTDIAGVDDLNGRKVCSVTGSTSLKNVQEQAPQADVSTVFDKYSLCVEALLDGRVEAVTTDDIILLGFVAEDPDNLKVVGNPFTEEPYGIGLAKGDQAMRDFVNDVLEASYEDGSWEQAFTDTVGASGVEAPTPPPVDRY